MQCIAMQLIFSLGSWPSYLYVYRSCHYLRKQFVSLALKATPEIRCCRKCQMKRLGTGILKNPTVFDNQDMGIEYFEN